MKRITGAAVAVALSLVLSGCGGDPETHAQVPAIEASTPVVTETGDIAGEDVTEEPDGSEPSAAAVEQSREASSSGRATAGAVDQSAVKDKQEAAKKAKAEEKAEEKKSQSNSSKPKTTTPPKSTNTPAPKPKPSTAAPKPKPTKTEAPKPKPKPTKTEAPKPKPKPTKTTPPPPKEQIVKKWGSLDGETSALRNARSNAGKQNMGSDATCSMAGTVSSLEGASGILNSSTHRAMVMNPNYARLLNARVVIEDRGVSNGVHWIEHWYTVDVYNCLAPGN